MSCILLTGQDERLFTSYIPKESFALQSMSRHRQQTFYSKKYQSQNPVGSKQPIDEGINDVQMGVLCCQTETGLGYRGRWKRKPVSVKVKIYSICMHFSHVA